MKIFKFLSFCVSCAVVGSFVGYFGGALYYVPPKTSADLAAWAGAIGTIAAFVGTVLLATRQSREKRRTDLNLAALVAAGVMPGIAEALHATQWVEEELINPPAGHPPNRYLDYSNRLKLLCPWDAQSIQPLAILPNDVGYHLEFARSRIQFAQKVTEQWAANGAIVEGLIVVHVAGSLREARSSLNKARDECKKITPPIPTIIED